MGKKKVCFITLGNLYLCPYISKYLAHIECDYDIIYWNRHDIDEQIGVGNTYAFNYIMDEGVSNARKLIGYLKFRKYAKGIIKVNNYDGLILLQTTVGILLQTILKRKFKKRYIVDIRDYTLEKNPIFFAKERTLIENSAYSVISSKGYEKFLPPHNYIIAHNDMDIAEKVIRMFENRKRNKDRIVISCIGLIRFEEQNKKVILKFKNDARFFLRFIGKGAYALREFCEVNNVNNVELIDWFPPDKTLDYYYETDIINNLYGNNTPLLNYALSNKLYFAAKLKIPILVSKGTYMEEVSNKYGLGFTFKLDDSTACDDLFTYYTKINWKEFMVKSDSFIRGVNNDNRIFNNVVQDFVQQL